MGFFSSLGKSLGFGGSSNAGRRAAEQRAKFNREAIARGDTDFARTEEKIGGQQEQLREDFTRQRGQTEEGFAPFIEGGIQGQEFLREASTAEGFNKFLEQITGGSLFQTLRDEQLKTAQGQAAAGGQTVSGETLRFLSQLPPQLALQLEGELFGRNRDLTERGFRGVERRGQLGTQLTLGQGQLSTGLVDLESQLRDRVSGRAQRSISDIGGARSSGILADEQIDTQRINNLINLVGTAGSFVSGGIGGGGGGGTPFTATPETLRGTRLPSLRNPQGNFF